MKQRILSWMGLIILFLLLGISQETLAQKTSLGGENIRNNHVFTIPNATRQKTTKGQKLSTSQVSYYTVKKGDSVYSIAKKAGISINALKKANNLRSNALNPGQKIRLTKLDLKPGEIAKSVEPKDLDENEDSVPNNDSLGTVPLADAEKDISTSAELMGKWRSPDERRLFIKVAMAFLGAPYRWGGVNLRGIDCSAFVQKIYELFGISLPRTAYEQAQVGVQVAKNKLTLGDLVFFNTERRSLGHVGIYIGNGKFVHASSVGSRVVKIDGLDEPYYNKHFATARRLKGLDGEVLQRAIRNLATLQFSTFSDASFARCNVDLCVAKNNYIKSND